jgi:hypothetical protein
VSSALDAICFTNVTLIGQAASTNLDSTLQSWFDNYELTGTDSTPSSADIRDAVHDDTLAFPVVGSGGLRFVVVNGCSVPPTCMLPAFLVDATDFSSGGTLGQKSYDLTVGPRPILHPGDPAHLFAPGSSSVWTAEGGSPPSGWKETNHEHAIDNTEGDDFELRVGATTFGLVSPWHGYLVMFGSGPTGGSDPSNTNDDIAHQYHRVHAAGGGVIFNRAEFDTPGFELTHAVTTRGNDSSPDLIVLSDLRLLLVFHRAGTGVMQAFSTDGGDTFETPSTLMADGYFPRISSNDHGFVVVAAFYYDSGTSGVGTIKLRWWNPDSNVFSAAVTVKDGSGSNIKFEPRGLDVLLTGNAQDATILTAVPEGGGEPREWISYDSNDSTFELM